MKRLTPILLMLFILFNSCRKRSKHCDEPVLTTEEKAWMSPYASQNSFKYYFTNQFGTIDSVYSVELYYKYVHFSTDERCGTGMKAECNGVNFKGGVKFIFSASGFLQMHNPNNGTYNSFNLIDQPYNAEMYETTLDTTNQNSNFVYKIYYSKSTGIRKYITKQGQIFQRN